MVDLPTPPLPDETAMIRPRAGWSRAHSCGSSRIGDVDLDLVPANTLDCLDGRAGLAYQCRGIFGGEEKGEGDLAVVRDCQVPDHPGRKDVVLHTRILDPRQRRGDAGLQRFDH
jgi:hypothetical protein